MAKKVVAPKKKRGRPAGSKNAVKEEGAPKRKYTRRVPAGSMKETAIDEANEEKGHNYTINVETQTQENEIPMTELINALTALAREATVYLAKKNGTLAEALTRATVEATKDEIAEPAPAQEEAAAPSPSPEPKKRGRPAKAPEPVKESAPEDDLMADLGLPSAPAPAPVKEKPLTGAESHTLLIETATEYVNKFGKEAGGKRAKAHLAPYKVDKITALDHTQRLSFVATLKKDLAA